MIHARPCRWLRPALLVDAAASGTLAAFQLLVPHPLARLLGLPVELLIAGGAVLAGWTALLVWLANGAAISRWQVGLVVAGNGVWAAACAAVAAGSAPAPTPPGNAFLLIQAVVVVALAAAQATALTRPEARGGALRRSRPQGHGLTE